nr:MAG TPA: hypothetical protein [Caudoviricetes sp.]
MNIQCSGTSLYYHNIKEKSIVISNKITFLLR